MASSRPTAPPPTVAQVRDYVLTMLDGLAGLAESVQDLPTRDRMLDLADHLVMTWSPRSDALLRQPFELAAARAAGPSEAPATNPADSGFVVRTRP